MSGGVTTAVTHRHPAHGKMTKVAHHAVVAPIRIKRHTHIHTRAYNQLINKQNMGKCSRAPFSHYATAAYREEERGTLLSLDAGDCFTIKTLENDEKSCND